MGHMVKADCRRILSSWQPYAALICCLALALHPVLLTSAIWEDCSPLELFSMAMGISDFTPFAVIFAVLPYGASFCTDVRTGYATAIVSRVGFRKYARARWLSVALSGAAVMGTMMTAVAALCLTAAGQPETAQSASFLNTGVWKDLAMSGLWFYLLRVLLAGLFGSLWATVGLIFAAAFPNRYAALVLPFVAYQGLWYLLEGSILNPLYYFRADYAGIPSLAFAFAFQLFWNFAAAALAQFLMKRRLRR